MYGLNKMLQTGVEIKTDLTLSNTFKYKNLTQYNWGFKFFKKKKIQCHNENYNIV